MIWQCPNCLQPLRQSSNVLSCANQHSFDCARQGYVNLLLANQKRSREPGDSPTMVAARERFLALGHYDFLAAAIASEVFAAVTRVASRDAPFTVVDLGCGEGFYLEHILSCEKSLLDKGVQGFGIDISRPAIKRAAVKRKRFKSLSDNSKGINYAVASAFDMPIVSGAANLALSVFAPFSTLELQRIVASEASGWCIRVLPGSEHMFEIKQKLYDNPKVHKPPSEITGFNLTVQRSLTSTVTLSAQMLADLLAMTPLHWHGSVQAKQSLASKEKFSVTLDFVLQVFSKNEQP